MKMKLPKHNVFGLKIDENKKVSTTAFIHPDVIDYLDEVKMENYNNNVVLTEDLSILNKLEEAEYEIYFELDEDLDMVSKPVITKNDERIDLVKNGLDVVFLSIILNKGRNHLLQVYEKALQMLDNNELEVSTDVPKRFH